MEHPSYSDLMAVINALERTRADVDLIKNILLKLVIPPREEKKVGNRVDRFLNN